MYTEKECKRKWFGALDHCRITTINKKENENVAYRSQILLSINQYCPVLAGILHDHNAAGAMVILQSSNKNALQLSYSYHKIWGSPLLLYLSICPGQIIVTAPRLYLDRRSCIERHTIFKESIVYKQQFTGITHLQLDVNSPSRGSYHTAPLSSLLHHATMASISLNMHQASLSACPLNSTMFLSEQIYLYPTAASAGTTSSILHLSTPCALKLSVQVVTNMFLGFLKQMHDDGNSWKSSCFGLISSGSPIRPLWTFCTLSENISQPIWFHLWNSTFSFFAFGRIVLLWPMYRLHI